MRYNQLALLPIALLAATSYITGAQAQPTTSSAAQLGTPPAQNELIPGASAAQSKAAEPVAPAASGQGAVPVSKYDYVLGPGDKLRIIVFGEESLTGEFFVAGNGTLAFPLIGAVPAAGKTVGDLQNVIATQLRGGYLKDPRVSAQVMTFRPYFILGEVSKPGEYPYSDGMTIMNAVATAGGFTYRANHSYVMLKKAESPKPEKVRLTDQLELAPGDTVRVIERYF